MKFLTYVAGIALVTVLTACGGGGGSAGSKTGSGSGSGTSVTGDTQTTSAGSMSLDVLSGAGVSTNAISAVEISKVQVLLRDSSGAAVPGVVVTFSESGPGLLTFSPGSATALTDGSGLASIEIRALTTASTGATTVVAKASLSKEPISVEMPIEITSAPTGVVADPQTLANALNFLDTNPSDKSIVLAGAGGTGRSESATLRFRVVDKNNTPVKGAVVTFAAVPSTDVTLNIASATSDADGVVVTTVSSKSVATAVVVKATVTRADSTTIVSQSDTLTVTTGVATQAGFDLSATKYNLNSGISGDKSTITVRVVDSNGNPVADGVPVVFTSPYGAVGTSSRGGCVTVGGLCTVDYIVQDPRPADGVAAIVTASTQIGNSTSISDSLPFFFSEPSLLSLFTADTGGTEDLNFDFGTTCGKKTFTRFVGTPAGRPAPAGTVLSLTSSVTEVKATVKTGGTISDQLGSNPTRTQVDIEIDVPTCNATDPAVVQSVGVELKMAAGSISKTRNIIVKYVKNLSP